MLPIGSNFLHQIKHAFAGSIAYRPGSRFGPRMQQDLQLVLLDTGEMNIQIDGQLLSVPAGSATLLLPGHEELFHFSAQEETWHRWIAIRTGPLTPEITDQLLQMPNYIPLTAEMNRVTDLMLSLRSQFSGDSLVLRNLAMAALLLYVSNPDRFNPPQEVHSAVHLATHWMHHYYKEEITLKKLGEEAGVSPEHLIRLFRKVKQMTPMQYLWKYRVQRGKELLLYTGLSIAEIADQCGFKTSHHFAHLVKSETGQTPTQIRTQHWNNQPAKKKRPDPIV